MSKPKFKVGDRVKVVKITGSQDKAEHVGKTLTVSFILGDAGYKYSLKGSNGLSSGWYYSDEELELAKEDRTYTGIELLQAIKDGAFKDGDKFEVITTHNDEVACVTKLVDGVLELKETGYSVGSDILLAYNFRPIKKEPINLALENESLSMKMPIEILGVMDMIKVDVKYEDNKTTVALPSGIKGVAKCCPEDKFNRNKGTRLAFSRAVKKQLIKDMDKVIDGYM